MRELERVHDADNGYPVVLQRLQNVHAELELASTPQDTKQVVEKADAIRYLAKKSGMSREVQNQAAEVGMDARRKGGALLAEAELDKGTRGNFVGRDASGGYTTKPPESNAPKLGRDGMPTRYESMVWQVLSRIPEEKYETKVAEIRTDPKGELTTAALYKYGRNLENGGEDTEESRLRFGRLQFSEEAVVEAACQHYRHAGFPYRNLPIHVCMEQINKLATTPDDELMSSVVGYQIADTYHPHRFDGHALGMNSPRKAFDDDKLLRRALWLVMEERGVLGYDLLRKLAIVSGTQANSNFRPGFACYMYRQYCNPGDTVLDTSTGYGGRLVGFMAAGIAGKYIGVDPSIETHQGNIRMTADLGYGDSVELHNSAAEDVEHDLLRNRCDFAFTSPPYFRKEVYADEETQSARRYRTTEQWKDGFLVPMLALQYAALKDGALSALNIADVSLDGETIPLVSMAIEAAQRIGFTYSGSGKFQLQKRFGGGHADADVSFEEVLFFRKSTSLGENPKESISA